jgi:hypothetical protein
MIDMPLCSPACGPPSLLSPTGLPLLPDKSGLKRFPPLGPPPPPGLRLFVKSPATPHALSASEGPFILLIRPGGPLLDPGKGCRVFIEGILDDPGGPEAVGGGGTEVMKAISR